MYSVCNLSKSFSVSENLAIDSNRPIHCNVTAVIYSGRKNINERILIRKTWARWFENVHFFLGDRDCDIPPPFRVTSSSCLPVESYNESLYLKERKAYEKAMIIIKHSLHQENFVYNDMVFLPMVDYYDNLPEKFFESLKWILRHSNSSDSPFLIVKLDDDMSVVHTQGLLEKICNHMTFMGSAVLNTPLLFGTFVEDFIHRRGKYASLHKADREWYFAQWDTFPYGGDGYAMTSVLANIFVEHRNYLSQNMTQLEDVNIGMFLLKLEEKLNITVTKIAVGKDKWWWWEKLLFHMYTFLA